jgi:hypothetical protein
MACSGPSGCLQPRTRARIGDRFGRGRKFQSIGAAVCAICSAASACRSIKSFIELTARLDAFDSRNAADPCIVAPVENSGRLVFHLRPGMVFGFPPECCSAWPESSALSCQSKRFMMENQVFFELYAQRRSGRSARARCGGPIFTRVGWFADIRPRGRKGSKERNRRFRSLGLRQGRPRPLQIVAPANMGIASQLYCREGRSTHDHC